MVGSSVFVLGFAPTGGAVANYGPLTMANDAFVGCQAYIGSGPGGALFNAGQAALYNCTFAQNGTIPSSGPATTAGGAIANGGSGYVATLSLTNCILWGDMALDPASQEIYSFPGDGNTSAAATSAAYSDLEGGLPAGGTDGGHNIDADPQFDTTNPFVRNLTSTSPCINSGANAVVSAANGYLQIGGQFVDLIGNARIMGSVVDMGATEFPEALSVTDVTPIRRNSTTVAVTAQIVNPNSTVDTNVTVTSASLGGTNTISTLPILLGTIKSGDGKLCVLNFKNVPSGSQTLQISGTSDLGPFFTTVNVTVP